MIHRRKEMQQKRYIIIKKNKKNSLKKANIWKIMHQKAKYQENPEMQQAYRKYRY